MVTLYTEVERRIMTIYHGVQENAKLNTMKAEAVVTDISQ